MRSPMSDDFAVRCTGCEFTWNTPAMADGLRILGSCPKCKGELEFRDTAEVTIAALPADDAAARTWSWAFRASRRAETGSNAGRTSLRAYERPRRRRMRECMITAALAARPSRPRIEMIRPPTIGKLRAS